MFCLRESDNRIENEEKAFSLTYFQGPFDQKLKRLALFATEEGDECNRYDNMQKGNSHSQVIWYKRKTEKEFVLYRNEVRFD